MTTIGTRNNPLPTYQLTPHELDKSLHQQINDYISHYSWVKLEAALTIMIYTQFKPYHQQANDIGKQEIEAEIVQCIPSRDRIKQYLDDGTICYRHANTLANFFELSYLLNNHDPADCYQKRTQVQQA